MAQVEIMQCINLYRSFCLKTEIQEKQQIRKYKRKDVTNSIRRFISFYYIIGKICVFIRNNLNISYMWICEFSENLSLFCLIWNLSFPRYFVYFRIDFFILYMFYIFQDQNKLDRNSKKIEKIYRVFQLLCQIPHYLGRI